jgi:hypothetical protein
LAWTRRDCPRAEHGAPCRRAVDNCACYCGDAGSDRCHDDA